MTVQVKELFEDKEIMMRKLKKKTYEQNMGTFREKKESILISLLKEIEESQNPQEKAKEIGIDFCNQVKEAFQNKRGRISGNTQIDLNYFMIYYIFPAILLTEYESKKILCDAIKDTWAKTFKESNIGYTTYEEIYEGFRIKIFGIPIGE